MTNWLTQNKNTITKQLVSQSIRFYHTHIYSHKQARLTFNALTHKTTRLTYHTRLTHKHTQTHTYTHIHTQHNITHHTARMTDDKVTDTVNKHNSSDSRLLPQQSSTVSQYNCITHIHTEHTSQIVCFTLEWRVPQCTVSISAFVQLDVEFSVPVIRYCLPSSWKSLLRSFISCCSSTSHISETSTEACLRETSQGFI